MHEACVRRTFYQFTLFLYSSGSSWLKVTPWGIRQGLNWIKKHYNNVPVYVTENGVSDNNGTVHDQHRIDYLKDYINEVLKGIALLILPC